VLNLDPAWYDAIAVRRSRRRFSDRPIDPEALDALRAFCAGAHLRPGARIVLVEHHPEIFTGLLRSVGGAYGRVEGASLAAAFVGRRDALLEVGYLGEAFVLEATRLGLGTCWVAGMFDQTAIERLVRLAPGERVAAVTPVGHPVERKQPVERMMSAAVRSAVRRRLEDIVPELRHGRDGWPRWALGAVAAARLAPSGANRQPWRFRLQGDTLVLSSADSVSWTAPIDFGIAMLHAELGAAHEGVRGAWQRLPPPGVAGFVTLPAGRGQPSSSPLP
jgi:nitroreductase